MIKSYNVWIKEKQESGEQVSIGSAYNAALKSTTEHYEKEAVATAEYYASVLRRTSGIDLKIAIAIMELADTFPECGAIFPTDFDRKIRNMVALLETVKETK